MVDGVKALQSAMILGFGLQDYKYIMNHYSDTNISDKENFEKCFNYYYKVRRNKEWRSVYYSIFETFRLSDAEPTFEDILNAIYDKTDHKVEASFASKMLATLNSNKPILDQNILSKLNLQITGETAAIRKENAILVYNKIENWYSDYLQTDEAKKNIELFDYCLGEYKWLSDVKKIDCMLWVKDKKI